VPPRVREVVARLKAAGYVLERQGKSDHTIYRNPATGDSISIDGAPNHEMPFPVWRKMKKRLGWSD
jgi:predicted RNA binding protein YcfA (HicA-like mRNA interferase family)